MLSLLVVNYAPGVCARAELKTAFGVPSSRSTEKKRE